MLVRWQELRRFVCGGQSNMGFRGAKEMRVHARLVPEARLSKSRHVRLSRFVPPILFVICAKLALTPATEHRNTLTVIGYLLGAKT